MYLVDDKIYIIDGNKDELIYDIHDDKLTKKRFTPKGTYLEGIVDGNIFYIGDGNHIGWDYYCNKKRVLRGVGDASFATKDAIYFVETNWHRERATFDTIERYDIQTKKREKITSLEFILPEAKERKKEWNDYSVRQIYVKDEYVIYTIRIIGEKNIYNDTRIYVFNTTTGVNTEIKYAESNYNTNFNFIVYKDEIYFLSMKFGYKYNMKNENLTSLITDFDAYGSGFNYYIFDDEFIYFVFNDSLNYPAGFYRVPASGGKLEPYFLFE